MRGGEVAEGVYEQRVTVRFGDCDPAGILYYPTYFDFFHRAMEGWFEACLDLPYAEALGSWKLGFPTVHTEADYRRPTFFGDTIRVELRVERLGGRSIHFGFRVLGEEGEVRVTGRTVCVLCHLEQGAAEHLRPRDLPTELRSRIEAWQAVDAASGG